MRHWFLPKFSFPFVAELQTFINKLVCQVSTNWCAKFQPQVNSSVANAAILVQDSLSSPLQEPSQRTTTDPIATYLLTLFDSCNIFFHGFGSEALVLTQVILSFCCCRLSSTNWCAKFQPQVNSSVANATIIVQDSLSSPLQEPS